MFTSHTGIKVITRFDRDNLLDAVDPVVHVHHDIHHGKDFFLSLACQMKGASVQSKRTLVPNIAAMSSAQRRPTLIFPRFELSLQTQLKFSLTLRKKHD
jgi:hypothetical protein